MDVLTTRCSCVHLFAFRDPCATDRTVLDPLAAYLAAHVMPTRLEHHLAFVGKAHAAYQPVIRRRIRTGVRAAACVTSLRSVMGTQ